MAGAATCPRRCSPDERDDNVSTTADRRWPTLVTSPTVGDMVDEARLRRAIGKTLRERREQLRLSREQFGDRFGVSADDVERAENGQPSLIGDACVDYYRNDRLPRRSLR